MEDFIATFVCEPQLVTLDKWYLDPTDPAMGSHAPVLLIIGVLAFTLALRHYKIKACCRSKRGLTASHP